VSAITNQSIHWIAFASVFGGVLILIYWDP
ncbi:uncharacterized protein METZ01_LOCUS52912, partial [marine metagenome]